MSILVTVILIAAAFYLALGAIGLSFAIAPGYASPIFPAAGFAVAILLWSDSRAWPGLWIGSFTLNLAYSWLSGELNWSGAAVAATIASGSTVQALAAWWLLVRSVKDGWRTMEVERDIFRALALAGPIACVVSAIVGVTTLSLAGIITAREYLYSWWSWWSGDTLGVLVMLPLTLTVIYRRHSPWRNRIATLILPMLIALGLVGAAFYATSQWERSQQKQYIRAHGENLAKLLEQRFIAHQEALSALRRLYEVTPNMTYQQFEHFTRITLKDNQDISALSINPYVLRAQRQAFERSMAAKTGSNGFEITERDGQRRLLRAADRPEYVAVGFISPLEGNRPAVGYDINSEPIRSNAIARAMRSGLPAVTEPIQLVQEDKKRVGVLILHPAHRTKTEVDGGTEQDPLMGFAVGVIKVDEMVEIATHSSTVRGLVFQVDDDAAAPGKTTLYRSEPSPVAADKYYAWQTKITVADRTWTLKAAPTEDSLRTNHYWAALVVGAGGLALAALLQALLLVTTGRTAVIQRKVQEQTTELQLKSDALEDRNAQLDVMFTLSPDGFVAFAKNGKIKFANPAFLRMTGIAQGDVIGEDEAGLDTLLRKRCEMSDAFAGISTYFLSATEDGISKTLTLMTPAHSVLQIVGMHSDSSSISRILYFRDITQESEVDRMKSAFLAHAAHELRTPMTSIFGFSELLLEMDLDEPTRRDLLETIHRQTKWLVDIINELLDLSRIEARRGKDLTLVVVELGALVRDTVANLNFDEKRWNVSLNLPAEETHVIADMAKLRQALTNVLSNAYKYSPNGGETKISFIDAPGRVGIAVSDDGIGMTPEQLRHFGEKFWRADTSGKTPGTGLGFAIVKEIIKLLGGNVEVRSEPKAGTTVTLWVPAGRTMELN